MEGNPIGHQTEIERSLKSGTVRARERERERAHVWPWPPA